MGQMIEFLEENASLNDWKEFCAEYLRKPKLTCIARGLDFTADPEYKTTDNSDIIREENSMKDTLSGRRVYVPELDMTKYLMESCDDDDKKAAYELNMKRIKAYPTISKMKRDVIHYARGEKERQIEKSVIRDEEGRYPLREMRDEAYIRGRNSDFACRG